MSFFDDYSDNEEEYDDEVYEDEDIENEETEQKYKKIAQKKQDLNNRLPPKKERGLSKFFNKFLKGKGTKGFAGLKIKLGIAAVIFIVIACIFLIIVAAFLLAHADATSDSAVSTREDGVKSLGINEQSSITDQKALENFNNTDSLVGFTTEQLKIIYDNVMNDSSTKSSYLRESGNKKVGELDYAAALLTGDYNTAFSVNAKRSLYEHIQRTEKYNFNAIQWHEVGHNISDRNMSTEALIDRELIVPSGTDEEQLSMLIDLTSPYLFTNNIPMGLLSGLIGNSTSNSEEEAGFSEKFVYQVLKESLTKMEVYKYTVSNVKVGTAYEDCTRVPMQQTITLKISGEGVIVSNASAPVSIGEGTPIKTPEERYKEDEFGSEEYWYVTYAKTFDNIITNEYEFEAYSDSDYNNLVNPDSNTLVNTESIDRVENGTKYNNGDSFMSLASFVLNYPVEVINSIFNNGEVTINVTYDQITGQKLYYEKVWSDDLNSKKCEVNELTYSDIIEYNTKNDDKFSNFATDKKVVTEQEFKSDEEANKDYERYQEDDTVNKLYGLNMVDFLNSNPNIYTKYISYNSRSSDYKGVDRIRLKEAYRQVRKILDALANRLAESEGKEATSTSSGEDEKKQLPFVYGSSLGYEVVAVNSGSSGSSSLSGMDLLKAYLRSREGHEGLADENGNKLASTAIDQATYYIVGEVWNGEKYTRTVGYGIDLDTSGYEAEIMAAMGVSTRFKAGDLIPVEIVDKCEEDEISKAIDAVNAEFSDVDLKEYQIHALVSRYYNCGPGGWRWERWNPSNLTITEAYKRGWNEERDDKYEELYETYKDNQGAKDEIISNVDYNNEFYTLYMSIPTNDGVLVTRRQSEWILFSLGYYDSLQKFWTNSLTPGGIDLYNTDGSINEEAAAELTDWFVDNFFSGDSRMRFSGMGGFDKDNVNSYGVKLNTEEYPFLNNGLSVYQCTWWARVRATYQASMLDPEHLNGYIKTSGNGCQVASQTANYYNIQLNTNVENIKPNSIVSFNEFSAEYPDAGHVAYVEAVDYDNKVFYVSHCGGGHSWYGITKKTFANYSGSNAGKFGGSVAVEDIVNSAVYQGGNG